MGSGIYFAAAGKIGAGRSFGNHIHGGFELIYVASGACVRTINDEVGALPGITGTLFVTPPGVLHNLHSHDRTVLYYARAELRDPEFFDCRARTLDVSSEPLFQRWFEDLFELSRRHDVETCASLLETIIRLIHNFERKEEARNTLHPAVRSSIIYMDRHFSRQISMAEVSKHAGVTPNHLNTLFQHTFGFGPSLYLQRLRIAHACELLKEPFLSVGEIAVQCGFSDQNYLCRNFRKIRGMTPTEFRRTLESDRP